ncbi:MAG: hypothetical protein E7Z91_04170 [Cyanobacteria bacterium SIG30]|nr:hypothetical protein [Cyanobacteria bacterium SIG30]
MSYLPILIKTSKYDLIPLSVLRKIELYFRASIIRSIIGILALLFATSPRVAIIVAIVATSAFIAYRTTRWFFDRQRQRKTRLNEREHALQMASEYLKDYADPFGVLCLKNENCIVRHNGKDKIVASGKLKKFRNSKNTIVTATDEMGGTNLDNAFNFICINFDDSTNLDIVCTALKTSGLLLNYQNIETGKKEKETEEEPEKIEFVELKKEEISTNKLDINKATSEEIQKLPGINIVIAKKIIMKRNEKDGFESFEDFIQTMEIKPHFAKKLKELVTVSKKTTNNKKKKVKGRILDI